MTSQAAMAADPYSTEIRPVTYIGPIESMARYIWLLLLRAHTTMASGSASGGEDEILGVDRRLVFGVAAILVVVAIAAVAAIFVFGDDDPNVNANLDAVPQGADGVVYIDGNVTEDELMLDTIDGGLAVGWWFLGSGQSPGADALLETIGDDSIDYDGTTVYLQAPDDDEPDYAGAVVELGPDSQSTDLVDLVEDEVGDLDEDTYNGVDIYEIDVVDAAEEAELEGVTDELDVTGLLTEFIGEDITAWIATPDDQTVILGSDDAVADGIDVYLEEAEPFDNEVRESHEQLSAAQVESTVDVDVLDEPLDEVASVVSADVATALSLTGGNPEYISSTYDVRNRADRMMTLDITIAMEQESGAEDLFTLFEGFVEPDEVIDDPDQVWELDVPDRAGGGQDGKYIQFEVPLYPEQLVGYVADFADAFGPDPHSTELVPAAADSIVEVNGTLFDGADLTDETSATVFDEALEAGLLDGEHSPPPQEVLDRAEAEGYSYETATTWRSNGDDSYVATFVQLDKPAEDLIETDVRQNLLDREAGDFEHREDEDGYRHVDVYDLPPLNSELRITRYLSGFQADGETEWIVPINNDSVIFGSEEAVSDAIDIYRGAAAPPETDLHEVHNRTDGLITVSGDVSDTPVAEMVSEVDNAIAAALSGESMSAAAAGYQLGEDAPIVVDGTIAGTDEDAANSLQDSLSEVVGGTMATENLEAPVHERAGLDREDRFLTLEVPYEPEGLIDDIVALTTTADVGPTATA